MAEARTPKTTKLAVGDDPVKMAERIVTTLGRQPSQVLAIALLRYLRDNPGRPNYPRDAA